MRKHVCLCNCITSNERSRKFEAFSKMAFSEEKKFVLDDYYQRGMQGQGKVHHLLITEAMEATGLRRQQVVVSCCRS